MALLAPRQVSGYSAASHNCRCRRSGGSRVRVLFATRHEVPGIDPDDQPLADALIARGVEVMPAVWSDPVVDWAAPDLCLIRSTWDYHRRLPEFLGWAERVSAVTQLWNEIALVRWNARKQYLEDIRSAGVPVIPTVWLQRSFPIDLAGLLDDQGWSTAVIKPTVSADSFGTHRVSRSSAQQAQVTLDRLLESDDMMVQPYFNSVENLGERSLIFIAGELTHTIRRGDVFGKMTSPFDLIEASSSERTVGTSRTRCRRKAGSLRSCRPGT